MYVGNVISAVVDDRYHDDILHDDVDNDNLAYLANGGRTCVGDLCRV